MTTPSAPAPAVSLKPDDSLDAGKLLTAFLAFTSPLAWCNSRL